ncbi:MAG: ORF6N domain-containing protein [Prevotellaceae bacterium]|nr:ORF6N domain-containing protein [Candidatus Faecinaster equi]
MAKDKNIVISETIYPRGIQTRIYEIRGERVMIDCDLAELYGVATKVLNQAVKRNMERFPEKYMFRLDNQEVADLRSQVVTTSNTVSLFGKRTKSALPYAFTEQGVAMLSAVLKSQTAIQVSIAIMDAFVQIRRMITENKVQALGVNELRARMALLEENMENNLGAINDLSEDVRRDIDDIYEAIAELSIKQKQLEQQSKKDLPRIGYEAIAEKYEPKK